MRILIDTNIVINREQYRVVEKDLIELLRLLNEIKSELVVHPLSIEELRKDKDPERREINLSKVHAYSILKKPPDSTRDAIFNQLIPHSVNPHDKIDNEILYALYKNSVNYLITEDKGIHKKAQFVGVSNSVFLVSEALEYFTNLLPSRLTSFVPPALKEEYLYNINLHDPFFDSLREVYDFDTWFKKVAAQGRKCYVHERSDGTIGAILIYKIENEAILTVIPLPQKKRLKISTMKVEHVGYKIGELLLKVAIDVAIKNNLDEIYLTHFTEEEDYLVNLLLEYGFYKAGIKPEKNEDVYLKHLCARKCDISGLKSEEISRIYYPSICDIENVRKFVIPIIPTYHNRLFTDYKDRQTELGEHFGEFAIEGNTIKKVYLTRSNIRKINPGDIIFFYRSHDKKAITSVGVVVAIYYGISDSDVISEIIGKRSVYKFEEIESMKKPLAIILFRHHFHLNKDIPLKMAEELGILSGHPQSISEISEEQYVILKSTGGINERFTLN